MSSDEEEGFSVDDREQVKRILRFFRSKRNLTAKEVEHEVTEMRFARFVRGERQVCVCKSKGILCKRTRTAHCVAGDAHNAKAATPAARQASGRDVQYRRSGGCTGLLERLAAPKKRGWPVRKVNI